MGSNHRRLLRSVAAALAITLMTWPATLASAADKVAFTIKDSRITQSSGLTRDTKAGIYWTVNDSGEQGTAYGITPDGFVRGIIGFRAKPKDVEAVVKAGDRLYVADIGDNLSKRKFVSVYYFNHPDPNNRTVSYRSYDFSYPDGRHDAETLLVDGNGRLFIVTKGVKGGIYAAPQSPSRQGVNKLRRVADAPAFVTDGTFLPGGNRIVLRTYVSVDVLDASSYKTVASAATPWQPQSESVAVTLDGSALLIGSEGKRSEVLQIPIPKEIGQAPSAGATPPRSPQPTPSSSDSTDSSDDEPTDEADTGAGTARTGTILALALAGFVALVAGVTVAAVRKR
jgi:hypothetical protein